MKVEKTNVTHYQFRLNGIIITHIIVRPVMVHGVADWQLVVRDQNLGEFALDDNEALADPALSRFILEVRDVTIPPIERRLLPNKGWKQMTIKQCIAVLESSGVIENY
jgi:hypothetical protein